MEISLFQEEFDFVEYLEKQDEQSIRECLRIFNLYYYQLFVVQCDSVGDPSFSSGSQRILDFYRVSQKARSPGSINDS